MKKCDFCDRDVSDNSLKYFPTNSFVVSLYDNLVPIFAKRGVWGACDLCKPFVERRDLDGLTRCLLPEHQIDAKTSRKMHEAVLNAIRWEEVEGYVYDEREFAE